MQSKKTSDLRSQKDLAPIDFEGLIDLTINKPARYMGNELGVKPQDWESAKTKWVLIYPDLYEVGASNLGHIILYSILNQLPYQLCDRAYLPAPDLAKRLRERSQSLFAIENRRPLKAFDIIGFSISYELGATNILEILNLSKIPIYSSQRDDLPINDALAAPLVFAGGPTATSNPEPYAPFFDFFALGDGEELLPEIGLVIAEAKESGLTRSETLKDLSEIPGIYVPSLFTPSKDQISIQPINKEINPKILRRVSSPIPHYGMGLVPNIETVHNRLTIEIRRGCTRGCRFCQPGMLTRPARDVDPNEVIKAVEMGMEKTGFSDFSLLSLSCSDYLALPAIGVELRNRLADQNITLQLPSQRIDRFNDDIAHILGGTRQAGLTFAPEAGTQRLRDIINKGLTDKDLTHGIRKAMENGYRKIKLYFMIGLPGETDLDIIGIKDTCQMLQENCKDLGKLSLNITISNFTPKPHTPFQWHQVSKVDLERRQSLLKDALKPLKAIKANFTDVRLSAMEDFIGRGNRQLAPVIESAWKKGAGMDAWYESLDKAYKAWTDAIEESGLEFRYKKTQPGSPSYQKDPTTDNSNPLELSNAPLPWDHIDTGINKKWLANDLKKSLSANVTPDCSFSTCSNCGVCGPELGENIIIQAPPIPTQKFKQVIPTEKNFRLRMRFSKKGSMCFLSHLDIVRVIERALKRSRLPVSFSGGYHPLPRIQIALALPLGVEAEGEWMSIDFTQTLDPDETKNRLQENLPDGLTLLSSESISINSKSLSQNLFSAKWSFLITTESLQMLNIGDWDKALSSIIESKELIWRSKNKKGNTKEWNYKESLKSLQIIEYKSNKYSICKSITIAIQLESLIDNMGRSIKPIQIQHWLEKYLETPLLISKIKRDELTLIEC